MAISNPRNFSIKLCNLRNKSREKLNISHKKSNYTVMAALLYSIGSTNHFYFYCKNKKVVLQFFFGKIYNVFAGMKNVLFFPKIKAGRKQCFKSL